MKQRSRGKAILTLSFIASFLLPSSKNHPNYSTNFSLQLVPCLFFFTLPVDWERGLIQQAEVELTFVDFTPLTTLSCMRLCVCEKETPKVSARVNAREKTTACIEESPHLWICPCMCVLELSALCCSMFFSLHNCQNVIPVTQQSSKLASSILKTI